MLTFLSSFLRLIRSLWHVFAALACLRNFGTKHNLFSLSTRTSAGIRYRKVQRLPLGYCRVHDEQACPPEQRYLPRLLATKSGSRRLAILGEHILDLEAGLKFETKIQTRTNKKETAQLTHSLKWIRQIEHAKHIIQSYDFDWRNEGNKQRWSYGDAMDESKITHWRTKWSCLCRGLQ